MDACLFLKKYVQVPFKFTYSTGKSIYTDPQLLGLYLRFCMRMSYMAWCFRNMSRSIASSNPQNPVASSTTARPHIKLRLTSWELPWKSLVGRPIAVGGTKKKARKNTTPSCTFFCVFWWFVFKGEDEHFAFPSIHAFIVTEVVLWNLPLHFLYCRNMSGSSVASINWRCLKLSGSTTEAFQLRENMSHQTKVSNKKCSWKEDIPKKTGTASRGFIWKSASNL